MHRYVCVCLSVWVASAGVCELLTLPGRETMAEAARSYTLVHAVVDVLVIYQPARVASDHVTYACTVLRSVVESVKEENGINWKNFLKKLVVERRGRAAVSNAMHSSAHIFFLHSDSYAL